MTSFKPIAACLALAGIMLPSAGAAADDLAALKAELQTLQTQYTERIGALEARVTQLETAASAAAAITPACRIPPPSRLR